MGDQKGHKWQMIRPKWKIEVQEFIFYLNCPSKTQKAVNDLYMLIIFIILCWTYKKTTDLPQVTDFIT